MADFPYDHDSGCKIGRKFNVLRKKYENNVSQARLVSSQVVRTAEPSYTVRTETEALAAEAFYDSRFGSLTPFTIMINGVEINMTFVEGSFWSRKVSAGTWEYGFQLEEEI